MKTRHRHRNKRRIYLAIAMGLLLCSTGCRLQSNNAAASDPLPHSTTQDAPTLTIPTPGDQTFESPKTTPAQPKAAHNRSTIMGFYVDYAASSCLSDLHKYASSYTDVSSISYTLNANGRLTGQQPPHQLFVYHLGIYLTVTNNYDANAIHTLLRNSDLQSILITDLTRLATSEPYAGVDLDLEHIPAHDLPLYLSFLHTLATHLHSHKLKLIVVSPLNILQDNEARDLGQVADEVILMAYDYTYITESPGPLAPDWWVGRGINQWRRLVSPNKLILGIGTYGYDWGGTTNHARSLTQIDDQLQQERLQASWDTKNGAPYYTYIDAAGQKHIVYFENQRSLRAKIELVKRDHLAGVSVWRLGLEDASADTLLRSLEQP